MYSSGRFAERMKWDDIVRLDAGSTMRTEANGSPERVDDVSAESGPVLSEQIQKHLGNLLAAAYAQEDAELSAKVRFAELLADLEAALGKSGDRDDAEFKRLLVGIVPALRRYAVSLTPDPAMADGLVQEPLMRTWRARARFEHGTNFEAWTFTILRNGFYSSRRKRHEVQDEDGIYTAR